MEHFEALYDSLRMFLCTNSTCTLVKVLQSSSWSLFYQRETAVRQEQRGKIRKSKIAIGKIVILFQQKTTLK